jgi:hypothetical protein
MDRLEVIKEMRPNHTLKEIGTKLGVSGERVRQLINTNFPDLKRAKKRAETHEEMLERKFWERVDIKDDGCWNYTGARTPYGYGRTTRDGIGVYAHRLVWEMAAGQIPETYGGMPSVVMHTCDNPSCVNPDHLRLGNMRLNMHDRDEKRRARGG